MLRRCWNGEVKLWQVFWIGGFLCNAATSIVILIFAGLIESRIVNPSLSIFLLLPLMMASVIWWWVSVWRCSGNADSDAWGWLAKAVVLIQCFQCVHFIIYG